MFFFFLSVILASLKNTYMFIYENGSGIQFVSVMTSQ